MFALCSFIAVQKFFRIMHSLERSGFPVELNDAGLPFANYPVLIDVNDCVHGDVPAASNRKILIQAG